jgi:hypothetical protein
MSSKVLSSKKIKEIKENIDKLPLEEKLDILRRLEDELFALRFKALLDEIRATPRRYPLTLEEITEEVELVRKQRYEGGN